MEACSAAPAAPAAPFDVEGEPYDAATLAFCRALPKLELHAHLNGSISFDALAKLIAAHPGPQAAELAAQLETARASRSLAGAFQTFDIIHRIITRPEVIAQITEQARLPSCGSDTCFQSCHLPEARCTAFSFRASLQRRLPCLRASDNRFSVFL